MPITQDRLKALMRYDPETGVFRWRARPKYTRLRAGDIAGSVNGDGYLHTKIGGECYKMHRLAFLYMTGEFPPDSIQIDHIDQNRHNNRWSNLRLATPEQNAVNTRQVSNRTGYRGVVARGDKFYAQTRLSGRVKYLGTFDSAEAAHAAWAKAVIAVRGPYQDTRASAK